MKESVYSTNARNQYRIESFFGELGCKVEYLSRKPAAIGMGQEVVEFKVLGFKPLDLEGTVLERWRELPIEVVG